GPDSADDRGGLGRGRQGEQAHFRESVARTGPWRHRGIRVLLQFHVHRADDQRDVECEHLSLRDDRRKRRPRLVVAVRVSQDRGDRDAGVELRRHPRGSGELPAAELHGGPGPAPPTCRGNVTLTVLGVDGLLPDSALGVKEPIPRWPFYLLIGLAALFLVLAFLFWVEENPGSYPRVDAWWARTRGRLARTIAPF